MKCCFLIQKKRDESAKKLYKNFDAKRVQKVYFSLRQCITRLKIIKLKITQFFEFFESSLFEFDVTDSNLTWLKSLMWNSKKLKYFELFWAFTSLNICKNSVYMSFSEFWLLFKSSFDNKSLIKTRKSSKTW